MGRQRVNGGRVREGIVRGEKELEVGKEEKKGNKTREREVEVRERTR